MLHNESGQTITKAFFVKSLIFAQANCTQLQQSNNKF